jgi:hypothetical protein
MTEDDFKQLQRLSKHLGSFSRVGVFSPTQERELFPNARAIPRRRWDLNEPGNLRFDLLVAANVFMYSPAPARWFQHVLASCKYFLLQDVVRRQRGSGEFGGDGDQMRYAVGDARPRVENSFDLASLGDRLLGFLTYHGGANEVDADPLHVIALFRGDRADPFLRIDDYPTGIRPLLPDLSPLHRILEKVEAHGLSYHLGIVPALLTDETLRFLRGLPHMVPTVHGYDHAYPRYAPLLRRKNDPYNQGTVGTFDEFKGVPYREILERLRTGRRILEEGLGGHVETYIPPCNRGNRRTGRALAEAGYQQYLSEKRIPGCNLPIILSDFNGVSANYDYGRAPDVVTLHVTWEWDLVRRGDTRGLDRLLDHLAKRKADERSRGARLGAVLSQG